MALFKIYITATFFILLLFGRNGCKGNINKSTDDISSFESFFPDEVRPDSVKTCFNGAYYRKVVSSKDQWLGIEGKVILPRIFFDLERRNPKKPGQYLDNPSIYMGGNMNGQETDMGLTWEVIKDKDGSISRERKAFRPFFRRSSYGPDRAIWITAPAKPEYYWYPGEEVQMSVQIISDGMIKLTVKGAGKVYEDSFKCVGYRTDVVGEFKRVNAIDQVGNEGKYVRPTKTRVLGAVWEETNLYRKYKNKIVSVPLNRARYTDMRCPDPKYFQIQSTEEDMKKGAEEINISGSGF